MNTYSETDHQLTVIGAGIVGISTALTLQRAGYQVMLLDKNEPGQETSFGNAGLLATSTLLPLNNPGLWHNLPSIVLGKSHYVKYDLSYVLSNLIPLIRFLSYTGKDSTQVRAKALKTLIYPSISIHQQWLQEAGILNRLRDSGWLKLYSSEQHYQQASSEHPLLQQNGVDIVSLDRAGIHDLEPHLPDCYARGLWVRDTLSVDNPGAINQAYFKLFTQSGGNFRKTTITDLTSTSHNSWQISTTDNENISSSQCVLCLGPWTRDFLKQLDIPVPMIYERGAHRNFKSITDQPVSRPTYDAEGGFVISPMEGNYRMTCGVYLADHKNEYNWQQLNNAEKMARSRFPLGETDLTQPDWTGTRPALPDYLPIIGQTSRPGLWVNAGHQHIGLTMAPASAQLLAELMRPANQELKNPFSIQRF